MGKELTNTKAFYNTEIPSDWDVKKLYEIADVRDGTHESPKYFEHGVKFLTSKNIKDGELDFSDVSFITEEDAENFNKRSKVDKGDILMSMIGTIGNSVLVDFEPDFCIKNVGLIKPKNIDRYFLIQFYHSPIFQNYLARNLDGGIQKFVSLGGLRDIPIPLPPLPEQKAIAQVLSTADAAIHTTEKLIAQKELHKKWLMQQLLTGKKRLKGFGGEWKEMHLGEMFTERNDTKYFDLPLLSIGQNGVYPQDESIKKDTSNEDKSKYKRICPGDIGYNTMRMWQGRSALSDLEGIVSPAYTVVSPKKNTDSLFFSYLFKMPKMTNLFWRNSQGLVDDTLNCKFKDFSIVKVFLPTTKEEQTAIAQVLQVVDKEISLLKAKAEKLREQKKGLMQQLLTGKVRLKIN
jgi:type I restriction enzyme, S subunit